MPTTAAVTQLRPLSRTPGDSAIPAEHRERIARMKADFAALLAGLQAERDAAYIAAFDDRSREAESSRLDDCDYAIQCMDYAAREFDVAVSEFAGLHGGRA